MDSTRRLATAALLVTGVVLLAGCNGGDNNNGGGGGTANSTINIVPGAATLGMAAFSPPSDTVHVGQTVRMHNGDSTTHNIQSDPPGGFPSWGSLPANTNVTITANVQGTFPYKCTIASHTMTGTLVVLP